MRRASSDSSTASFLLEHAAGAMKLRSATDMHQSRDIPRSGKGSRTSSNASASSLHASAPYVAFPARSMPPTPEKKRSRRSSAVFFNESGGATSVNLADSSRPTTPIKRNSAAVSGPSDSKKGKQKTPSSVRQGH